MVGTCDTVNCSNQDSKMNLKKCLSFHRYANILVFYILSGWCLVTSTGEIKSFLIDIGKLPLKGTSIELVCSVSNSVIGVNLYKNSTYLTQCRIGGSCDTPVPGITFTSDASHLNLSFANLTRERDNADWFCQNVDNTSDVKDRQLVVYSNLTNLSLTIVLTNDTVSLTCKTGCVYPQPNMAWFYTNESGATLSPFPLAGIKNGSTVNCQDSEAIYISTLNFDTALLNSSPVQLKCVASYSSELGQLLQLDSEPSDKIYKVSTTISPTSTSATATTTSGGTDKKAAVIGGVGGGGIALLIIIIIIIRVCYVRRTRQ